MLIKNVYVVSHTYKGKFDIRVENGLIKEISENLEGFSGEKIIEAKGLHLFPGFIDMHSHFREPGDEDSEDLESGAKSALWGGYTTVLIMPNTNPPLDSPERIAFIKRKADNLGLIDIFPVGCITKDRKGEEIVEMGLMVEQGAIAFSDDGNWVKDGNVMRRALEYSKYFDAIIISHAEDEDLTKYGESNESFIGYSVGLGGIPKEAEIYAIFRDIKLAELTGGKLHIAHITTSEGVELVKKAKEEGIQVSCEITPHHLVLDESYMETYKSVYKMKPPLREKDEVEKLRYYLSRGYIDVIATDHAPWKKFDKEKEFSESPFGVIGLESAFPVLYSYIVKNGIISLEHLIELLTFNPSRLLNLTDRGDINVGLRADFSLFDLNKEFVFEIKGSKSRNCPFIGWKVQGEVKAVFVKGNMKLDNL